MAASTVRPAPPRIVPAAMRTARARWSAAVFAVAACAMFAIYHDLWTDPTARVLGSKHHSNDPMQMMWFLKWVPWSIIHGHNPLATNAIYYPHGIALTWNTFVPTLGILAAPITLTMGAAISFAVLITLGPALTTLTGFWWLRRHTHRPIPAAVGAFAIGFSPFVAGHLLGHLNLVFLPLIPLILMLIEDLLWRAPRPTRRTVGYLAMATAAQIGISEELLLILAVAVVVAIVAAVLISPAQTVPAVRRATPAVLTAAGICVLLTSPLLVSQLFLTHPVALQSQAFHAVPGDYVHSVSRQLINTANGHRSLLGAAEDGVYLGWPFLALLIIAVLVTWRRDRFVRVAVITGLAMAALTLGTNGLGQVWLPWRLLQHLPEFSSVLPARFAMATSLVIAWLLSRWLTALCNYLPTAERLRAQPRRTAMACIAAATLVAVPLVSLAPRTVGTTAAPPRVPFFASSAERRLLPPGAGILLLPMAWPGNAEGMYYQELADYRFCQVGGYGLTADRRSLDDADTLRRLGQRSVRAARRPLREHGAPAPTLAEGRAALRRVHPDAIVVVLNAPDAPALVALADELTGRPANVTTGGVSVWLLDSSHPDATAHLPRLIPPVQIA